MLSTLFRFDLQSRLQTIGASFVCFVRRPKWLGILWTALLSVNAFVPWPRCLERESERRVPDCSFEWAQTKLSSDLRFRSLPITFLTSQLAFDSEDECRRFLECHHALHYYENQSDTWDTKPAKDALQLAALQTRKVDIKGQL